jgi:hypothetical protein
VDCVLGSSRAEQWRIIFSCRDIWLLGIDMKTFVEAGREWDVCIAKLDIKRQQATTSNEMFKANTSPERPSGPS